jgi:tetratricopeptide (TPR) repeat protein
MDRAVISSSLSEHRDPPPLEAADGDGMPWQVRLVSGGVLVKFQIPMSLPEIAGHELRDLIGSGACGAVYRARSADGRDCAVKVFSSMAINRRELGTALEALMALPCHPGVIVPEQVGMERSPYHCVMPLEGAPGNANSRWRTRTLENLCQQGVQPDEAWTLIYELAEVLAWLHRHGIPHGNLRPCNILVSDSPRPGGGRLRLTDAAQGWVGGIHHLELADHFVYLCPEQAENPGGVFTGYGPCWDVYSFGVIAFRLLTGRLPRGDDAWAAQVQAARAKVELGLAHQIDSLALLDAVRRAPPLQWHSPHANPWDERRRSIIERALSLNPNKRWRDMREVTREFEILESDSLLEESRAQTVQEREKQRKKVAGLRILSGGLAAALAVASAYAGLTWKRATSAESILAASTREHEQDVEAREQRAADDLRQREERIQALVAERDGIQSAKSVADANLRHAQATVDHFLTQILQSPIGNDLEVEFSMGQLSDALKFSKQSLAMLEGLPDLGIERARAHGNLAQIYLRLKDEQNARIHLDQGMEEAEALMSKNDDPALTLTLHQMLGRYGLWLAEWHQRHGKSSDSMNVLRSATTHLRETLAAEEGNRLARLQAAKAFVELAARSYDQGELNEADKALDDAFEILAKGAPNGDESVLGEEAFLLASGQFSRGLILRERAQVQQAFEKMIEAVQMMGEIVTGSSPRNQDHALALAEAYTIVAELVGVHFNAKDSLEAHEQAMAILLELNRLLPEWAEVKYLIARNNGAVSQIERDMGKTAEAARRKQDAIELINEVLADHPDNPRYRFLLGRLRAEYAGFLADGNKPVDAVAMAKLAAQTVESVLEGGERQDGAPVTPTEKECKTQLAQIFSVQGFAYTKMGQKGGARDAFTRARDIWQNLQSAGVSDDMVTQGLAMVEDKLSKLQ